MNINIARDGRNTDIAFAGRFTFAAHSEFRDLISKHIETMSDGGRITFDLSGVEFVDSAALGMLLLAREGVQRRAGTITLRGARGQVRRMLDVSRFNALFTVEA